MASRPRCASWELAHWEYLVEPLKSELRQLGGVGFTTAAVTAMYHRRLGGEEATARHEKILLEELTILRGPLQRATNYANQMMRELEHHSAKRRRITENPTSELSPRNEYNTRAGSRDAAGSAGEVAADGPQIGADEDPWTGVREFFSKGAHACTCR